MYVCFTLVLVLLLLSLSPSLSPFVLHRRARGDKRDRTGFSSARDRSRATAAAPSRDLWETRSRRGNAPSRRVSTIIVIVGDSLNDVRRAMISCYSVATSSDRRFRKLASSALLVENRSLSSSYGPNTPMAMKSSPESRNGSREYRSFSHRSRTRVCSVEYQRACARPYPANGPMCAHGARVRAPRGRIPQSIFIPW